MATGIPFENNELMQRPDLPEGEFPATDRYDLFFDPFAGVSQAVADSQGIPDEDEAPPWNRTRMIGEGVGNVSARIAGSAVDMADTAVDWLDEALGENGDIGKSLASGVNAVHGTDTDDALGDLADWFDKLDATGDLGSVPVDTIDKWKEVRDEGSAIDLIEQSLWTGLEIGATSLPEMAAIMANPALGAMAAFQRNHIEAKEAMGIEGDGTTESKVRATAATLFAVGGASYVKRVAGLGKKAPTKDVVTAAPKKGILRKVGAVVGGAVKVSAVESGEEVGEYAAVHQGVDATREGYIDSAIGGALGGLVIGGGAKTVSYAASKAIPTDETDISSAGMVNSEQSEAINAGNGQQQTDERQNRVDKDAGKIFNVLPTKVGKKGELVTKAIADIKQTLKAISKSETPEEAQEKMESLQKALDQAYGDGNSIIKAIMAKKIPFATNVTGDAAETKTKTKTKKTTKKAKTTTTPPGEGVTKPSPEVSTEGDLVPDPLEGGGQDTVRETQSEYDAQLKSLLQGGKKAILFNKGESKDDVQKWVNASVKALDAEGIESDEAVITTKDVDKSNKYKKLQFLGKGKGISIIAGKHGVIALRAGTKAAGVKKAEVDIKTAVRRALETGKGLGKILGYGEKADEDYSLRGEDVTVVTDKQTKKVLLVVDGGSPETAAAALEMFEPVDDVDPVVAVVSREEAIKLRLDGEAFSIKRGSPASEVGKLAAKASLETAGAVRAGDISAIASKIIAFIDEGALSKLRTVTSRLRDARTSRTRPNAKTGTTKELTDAVKSTMPIVQRLLTNISAWNSELSEENQISNVKLYEAITPLVKDIQNTRALNAEALYNIIKEAAEDASKVEAILADTAIPVEKTDNTPKVKGSKVIPAGEIVNLPLAIHSNSTRLKRRLTDAGVTPDIEGLRKLVEGEYRNKGSEGYTAKTITVEQLRKIVTALKEKAKRTTIPPEEIDAEIANLAVDLTEDDIIRKYKSDKGKPHSYKTIGTYRDKLFGALTNLKTQFEALDLRDEEGKLSAPKALTDGIEEAQKKYNAQASRRKNQRARFLKGETLPDTEGTINWLARLRTSELDKKELEAENAGKVKKAEDKRKPAQRIARKAAEKIKKDEPVVKAQEKITWENYGNNPLVGTLRAVLKIAETKYFLAIEKLNEAKYEQLIDSAKPLAKAFSSRNLKDKTGALKKAEQGLANAFLKISNYVPWGEPAALEGRKFLKAQLDARKKAAGKAFNKAEQLRELLVKAQNNLEASVDELEKLTLGQTVAAATKSYKSKSEGIKTAQEYLAKTEAKWAKANAKYESLSLDPTTKDEATVAKLKGRHALKERLKVAHINLVNARLDVDAELKDANKKLAGKTRYSTDAEPDVVNLTPKQLESYSRNKINAQIKKYRLDIKLAEVEAARKQVDARIAVLKATLPPVRKRAVAKSANVQAKRVIPQEPTEKTTGRIRKARGVQALDKVVKSGKWPALVKEAKGKKRQADSLEEERLTVVAAEAIVHAKEQVEGVKVKVASTWASGVALGVGTPTKTQLKATADRMGLTYDPKVTVKALKELIKDAYITDFIAKKEVKADENKSLGAFGDAREDMQTKGNLYGAKTRAYISNLISVITGTRELNPKELNVKVAEAIGSESKVVIYGYSYGQLMSFVRRYIAETPTTDLSENDQIIQAAVGDLIEQTNQPGQSVDTLIDKVPKQENSNITALAAAYATIPRLLNPDFEALVKEIKSRPVNKGLSAEKILELALAESFNPDINKDRDGRVALGLRNATGRAIASALDGEFQPLIEMSFHLVNAGISPDRMLPLLNVVSVIYEAKVQKNTKPPVDIVAQFNEVIDNNIAEYNKIKERLPEETTEKLDPTDRGFRMQAKIFTATDEALAAELDILDARGEFTDTSLATEQELADAAEAREVYDDARDSGSTETEAAEIAEAAIRTTLTEKTIADFETSRNSDRTETEPQESDITELPPLVMTDDPDQGMEGQDKPEGSDYLTSRGSEKLLSKEHMVFRKRVRKKVEALLNAAQAKGVAVPARKLAYTLRRGLHPTDPLVPLLRLLSKTGMPNVPVVSTIEQGQGVLRPFQLAELQDVINKDVPGAFIKVINDPSGTPFIYVNKVDGFGAESLAHEFTHNATSVAIAHDPVFRMEVRALLEQTRDEVKLAESGAEGTVPDLIRDLLKDDLSKKQTDHAFDNEEEFITAIFNNPVFQAITDAITAEHTITQTKYTVYPKGKNGILSILSKLITSIQDMLLRAAGQKTASKQTHKSILEVVIAGAGSKFINQKTQQALRRAGGGLTSSEVDYNTADSVEAVKKSGETATVGWTQDKLKYILGFMTTDNIVGTWGEVRSKFTEKDREGNKQSITINPFKEFRKAITLRDSEAKTFQIDARPLVHRGRSLANADSKKWEAFSSLVIDVTNAGVDISKPFPVLAKDEKNTQARKIRKKKHERLEKQWAVTEEPYRKYYKRLDAFFKTHAENARQAIIKSLVQTWRLKEDVAADLIAATTAAEFAAITIPTVYRKREGGYIPLPQWDDVVKAVKGINKSRAREGFYFPLKRYGEYFATASKDTKSPLYKTQEGAKRAAVTWAAADDYGRKVSGVTGSNLIGWHFTKKEKVYIEGGSSDQAKMATALKELGYSDSEMTIGLKADHPEIKGVGAVVQRAISKATSTEARAAIESAMINLLPENAAAKSLLHRMGVTGADENINRALADYIHSASWAIAGIKHGNRLRTIAQHVQFISSPGVIVSGHNRQRVGLVANELTKRVNQGSKDPGVLSEIAGKFGFIWYLMSLSYPVVNSTQQAVITYPHLAGKYGRRAAAKALTKAYGVIGREPLKAIAVSGAGLKHFVPGIDPNDSENLDNLDMLAPTMIKRLRDSGDVAHANLLQAMQDRTLIDATWSTMLTETQRGRENNKLAQYTENVMNWGRTLPFITEIVNRTAAAVAAYDLAIKAGSSIKDATDIAEDTVRKTHFDYSQSNRGRYLTQNTFMRALTMFKMHPIAMYGFMAENAVKALKTQGASKADAKKTLRVFFEMQLFLTGALGVAMFEPIKLVLGTALRAFGDDDDESFIHGLKNPEIGARTFFYDMGRETLGLNEADAAVFARTITHGALSLTDANFRDRIGVENMFLQMSTGSGYLMDDAINTMGDTFLGPIFGFGNNFSRFRTALKKGVPITEAMTAIAPKGLRDVMKAAQYRTEGMIDSRGIPIIKPEEFSSLELGAKYIGFSGTRVTDTYIHREYKNKRTNVLEQTKRQISRRWRDAETGAEKASVLKEVKEFNARLRPVERRQYRLTMATLSSGARRRRTDIRRTQGGATYRPKERPDYGTIEALGL